MATSDTARASRPIAVVAQRPARDVNAERAGAISSLVSVNEPVAHAAAGQRHYCHTNRTGRPNAGKSSSRTKLLPLDHTSAPQPPHTGRCRVRTCTTSGPDGSSSTPSMSTSPKPTNNSSLRVEFCSTGGLPLNRCLLTPILEDPHPSHGGPSARLNSKSPIYAQAPLQSY